MSKIIAIGNRGFVVALAGIGAEPVRCETTIEFSAALRKVSRQKDAQIVFVPEHLLAEAADAVHAFHERSDAALLGLPLLPSNTHTSLEQVRYIVEQATGARLI